MKKYLSAQNRALLAELVRTDFKLRYQGSALGYLWSLLKPLFLFAILYVVFVYFLRIGDGIDYFPVYLLLGIVMWNFFTEMTVQSLGSIVGRGDLIRKIRIPRWMIVFSSSIAATINLLLSLVVVSIFMIISQVPLSPTIMLMPFYIGILYIFALGLSFFLSAAYVKYRDISYIWEIILQAGFYATPILYPLQLIQVQIVQQVLVLSPVAFVIQGARNNLVTEQAITTSAAWGSWMFVLIPVFIAIGTLVLGALYFKSQADSFAENI
jgi:ABC-2 type transport system permease protein